MSKRPILLLTGCTGTFGSEFARLYADRYRIVGVSRKSPKWLAPGLDHLPLDLAADPRRPVDYVLERYGRLDVLVNAAACADLTPALSSSRQISLADQMLINAVAPFELVRHAFLRFWSRAGRADNLAHGRNVVNLGSILNVRHHRLRGGYAEHYGFACYAATKSALGALSRYLGDELEPHGVRVNLLAPGAFPAEQPTELVCRACAELIDSSRHGTVTTIDFGEVRTLRSEAEFGGGRAMDRFLEPAKDRVASRGGVQ